jgi:integrase
LKVNGLELVQAVDFFKVCHKSANVKPYKTPILKDQEGNLQKSWFVEFYFWSDQDQKLKRKRVTTVPGIQSPNRSKTKKQRYSEVKIIVDALEYLLIRGWTPENRIPDSEIIPRKEPEFIIAEDAINRAADLKKNEVKEKTQKDYVRAAARFVAFLKQIGLDHKPTGAIKRSHILDWLRQLVAEGAKPKTRNNYLGYLSGIFEKLIEEEITNINPTKGIKALQTNVELHQSYSVEQLKIISSYLDKKDPILKQYIKFIGYTFLRPSEILSIKARQINLKDRTIHLEAARAKRGKTEVIFIIDRLLPILQELGAQAKANDFLFTKKGVPGALGIDRTDFYSDKWNNYKKEINSLYGLDLGVNHTLYAMRHTFIQDIYRGLRTSCTRQEAEFKIQPITRHKTAEALRNYIRDFNLEIAADWSESYSLDF